MIEDVVVTEENIARLIADADSFLNEKSPYMVKEYAQHISNLLNVIDYLLGDFDEKE